MRTTPKARFATLVRQTALVIAITAVGLAGLEGVLRVSGFGHSFALFLPYPSTGRDALAINRDYTFQFFAPALAREPHPAIIDTEKSDEVFRVFVFGGSAAYGVPDSTFSFSRMLEATLEAAYPGRAFEIVNLGISATNSHVSRLQAVEAARRQPDLFVVYSGNNEVIGPYGAGTILTNPITNRSVIKTQLILRRTRLGQLAGKISASLGLGAQGPTRWEGFEMWAEHKVAADDSRLEAMYQNFAGNLRDICDIAVAEGFPVILCSVATNLRDFSPFASLHREDLNAEELAKWSEHFETGAALQEQGSFAQALDNFEACFRIDPRHAEMRYRMGTCHLALGRADQAVEHLRAARDLDALRFRADSRINDAVEQVSAEFAGRGVAFVDIVQAFSRAAADGIPGSEFFYEHCHLTPHGNYVLASAVFDEIVPLLGPITNTISQEDCLRSLGFTPVHARSQIDYMLRLCAKEPFTSRYDHATWTRHWEHERAALVESVEPKALERWAEAFEQTRDKWDPDWHMHRNLALLYEAIGRPDDAAEAWNAVTERMPLYDDAWLALARALSAADRYEHAVPAFEEAIRRAPHNFEVFRDLARLHAKHGELEASAQAYARALELAPRLEYLYAEFGSMYLRDGRAQDAIAVLTRGIEKAPSPGLHYYLGRAFQSRGEMDAAVREWHAGVRMAPANAGLWAALAAGHEALGALNDAVDAYKRVTELKPEDAAAFCRLAELYLRTGDREAAEAALHHCIRLGAKPSDYTAAELNTLVQR